MHVRQTNGEDVSAGFLRDGIAAACPGLCLHRPESYIGGRNIAYRQGRPPDQSGIF